MREPAREQADARAPVMWVAHCPFRKSGSPVLGTMGSRTEPVVVMTLETWQRLCAEIPALGTTEFKVGTWE